MQRCKSILVIEDDQDIRKALKDLLQAEGYRVYCAGNGKEGLELARDVPGPCLIFLDLMMPVMNGWDFLEAQKRNDVLATLPVVVMSALRASPKDAVKFLKKPIGLDSLLDTVREFCGPSSP